MKLDELEQDQIYLEWGNCSTASVICHEKIRKELYNTLAIKKKRVADDLIRLGIEDSHYRYYDPINMTISRGHIRYIIDFAKKKGYKLKMGDNMSLIKQHHPKYDSDYLKSLQLNINGVNVNPWQHPYDYQGNFIDWALTHRSGIGISATGSGKTLISYCIIRYLQHESKDTKILFIVPNVTLVKQGYSDFEEFSLNDEWSVEDNVSMLHGSVKDKKNFNNILITTWQSLKNKRKEFYEQYNHILVDEVHGADAKVLKRTIEKCKNAYTKIGMTGSLKGEGKEIDTHAKMTLEGLFGGRIEMFSDAKELMNRGVLPKLKLLRLEWKYPKQYKKDMISQSKIERTKKLHYTDKIKIFNEEKKFITSLPQRKTKLYDLLDSLNGNVLCLYNSIENMEYDYENYSGPVDKYKIYGTVSSKKREEILYDKMAKADSKYILFATFGTVATGISVDNIDIAVCSEFMKSRIKVLQSIGRLLRGDRALMIDIGDNIEGDDNYLMKHFRSRRDLYNSVGYDYIDRQEIIPYESQSLQLF